VKGRTSFLFSGKENSSPLVDSAPVFCRSRELYDPSPPEFFGLFPQRPCRPLPNLVSPTLFFAFETSLGLGILILSPPSRIRLVLLPLFSLRPRTSAALFLPPLTTRCRSSLCHRKEALPFRIVRQSLFSAPKRSRGPVEMERNRSFSPSYIRRM